MKQMPMRQFNPSTQVDFVVIGSGAGGAVMAKELAVAGFSVVVDVYKRQPLKLWLYIR